jgi:hypothetical protein
MLSLSLLSTAPAWAGAPLTVGAAYADPALLEEPHHLPSPGLSFILLSTVPERGGTVVRYYDVGAQKLREERTGGGVRALAWLDDRHYLLLRESEGSAVLELLHAGSGRALILDTLPQAVPARWSGKDQPYRLWSGRRDGAAVAALAVRRSDASFELRRYVLRGAAAPRVTARLTHTAAAPSAPADYGLLQVVPALFGQEVALIWRHLKGGLPQRQIDLLSPALLPLGGGATVRTVARSNEALSDCSLAGAARLLCHSRGQGLSGWLWLADASAPGEARLTQLTHEGGAAAYALAPDGLSVAYIGSGGADGPVIVQELPPGGATEQRQATLLPEGQICAVVSRAPDLFWLDDGRLLARAACMPSLQVVLLNDQRQGQGQGPAPQPLAEAEDPDEVRETAVLPQVPRPERPPRARKGRRKQMLSSFWTPRY